MAPSLRTKERWEKKDATEEDCEEEDGCDSRSTRATAEGAACDDSATGGDGGAPGGRSNAEHERHDYAEEKAHEDVHWDAG